MFVSLHGNWITQRNLSQTIQKKITASKLCHMFRSVDELCFTWSLGVNTEADWERKIVKEKRKTGGDNSQEVCKLQRRKPKGECKAKTLNQTTSLNLFKIFFCFKYIIFNCLELAYFIYVSFLVYK